MKRQLQPPIDGKGRVETGAVRFGDDWPGYFLRGEEALHIVNCIGLIERRIKDGRPIPETLLAPLKSLAAGIESTVPIPEWFKDEKDETNTVA